MKESGFIKAVTRLLPKEVHQQSMTGGSMTYGGTPDRYFDHQGDLWVEFKMAKTHGTRGYNVGADDQGMLSELQKKWLRRRHHSGGNAWVIVGVPSDKTRGFILDDPDLWEGHLPPAVWMPRLMYAPEIAYTIYDRIKA